jgi:hypothetical protein
VLKNWSPEDQKPFFQHHTAGSMGGEVLNNRSPDDHFLNFCALCASRLTACPAAYSTRRPLIQRSNPMSEVRILNDLFNGEIGV